MPGPGRGTGHPADLIPGLVAVIGLALPEKRRHLTPLNHPGALEQETPDWHVTAFPGPKPGEDGGPLLDAVRALRARILVDHGHRPALLRADGTQADDRDLDFGAWHFIARRSPGGPPLGYIRLSTPDTGAPFQSRDFLGDEPYGELLAAEGFGTGDVFEHSRLVVEHRARKLGLGLHLNALAIGAAHHLGARAVIGTSGTRDGQDRFHERFGFRPVRGTRRSPVTPAESGVGPHSFVTHTGTR